MQKVIFGIRGSTLAKAQLNECILHFTRKGIDFTSAIKIITTKGDTDKQRPIEELGQGVFMKELEQALLSGAIDCAIHSAKDIPVLISQETTLACFLPRADERDCLVSRDGIKVSELKGKRVATSSPRRQEFMKEKEPTIETCALRGNVDTRLEKLAQNEFDAMILAACGLKRLRRTDTISDYFDSDSFVPAAGQGALCAQIRKSDTELYDTLKSLSCNNTEHAVLSERRVLAALGIGCRTPFGVFARFKDGEFVITARAYFQDKKKPSVYHKLNGPYQDYERITSELIQALKTKMEQHDE